MSLQCAWKHMWVTTADTLYTVILKHRNYPGSRTDKLLTINCVLTVYYKMLFDGILLTHKWLYSQCLFLWEKRERELQDIFSVWLNAKSWSCTHSGGAERRYVILFVISDCADDNEVGALLIDDNSNEDCEAEERGHSRRSNNHDNKEEAKENRLWCRGGRKRQTTFRTPEICGF